MRRRFSMGVVLMLAFTLMAGCNKENPGSKDSEEAKTDTTPVTVTFAIQSSIFNEEQFAKYVVEPVKKKYPHITVERIDTSQKGFSIPNLVTAGSMPDLIGVWYTNLQTMKDLNLLQNMDPLLKKYHVDRSQFDKEIWDTLKAFSGEDYTVALPIYYNTIALLYNKDLFDKFGVPYPTDGMTWEDAIALGKKVGRTENGEVYTGFYGGELLRLMMQLNLPFTDPAGKKSALNTDEWKHALELWKSILDVQDTPVDGYAFEKGKVAMMAAHINIIRKVMTNKDINWDIVTYPQHAKLPGVGQRPDGPLFAVTSASKHQDAAFQVIQTVISPEVQLEMTKDGNLSTLKDPDIRNQFGQNVPDYKGKNIGAFLKPKFGTAVPDPGNPSVGQASKIVIEEFKTAIENKVDMNTALRIANERIDKILDQLNSN